MRCPTAVVVAACFAPGIAGAAEFRTGQPVMGTILQVTVIAETVQLSQRVAQECVAEARRWDDILTTWRPEGELAQLNAAAGGDEIAVSRDLVEALRRMQTLVAGTGGAFDPTVGSLVEWWRQPSAIGATSSTLRPPPMSVALHLGLQSARLAAGVVLDAGAIGKGMALDAIASRLRGRGIQGAFLDFGGSSQLAFDALPQSAQGWRLAVTGLDPGVLHGTFVLQRGSLSTSRATGAGAPEGPIIDPRSGRPVSERRLATVWHARATEADAWSTALVVLGRKGIDSARKAGAEVFFEDSQGTVATDGFRLEARARKTT